MLVYKNNLVNIGLWKLTWDGSETLNIRRIRGDIVEDIDQHQEDSDEEGHTARNNLGGD